MAADVSSLPKPREERSSNNSEILITKDFLGELSKAEGISHERCSFPKSPLFSWRDKQQQASPDADFRELNLNYPPSSSTTQINGLFEEVCLDLKLQSSSHYQSVCTLDKVKSALQRAEKETTKKRPSPAPLPLTTSSFSSSSSSSSGLFAASCPSCLLYVITLKTNPKCPRCNFIVPFPWLMKKAKIDLNASI